MDITLLGAHNCESQNTRLLSLLIDDSLVLDAGARRAVEQQGRSLLAIGVVDTAGDFAKGDVVALCDAGGVEFARGLTNYNAADIQRIKGLKSDKIAEALGYCPYDEVIHRDNMVLMA